MICWNHQRIGLDRFEPYHVLVMLGIQLVGGWGGFPLHQIEVSTREGFPILENAPKMSKKLSLPLRVFMSSVDF